MKKLKFAFATIALVCSTSAYAMPPQVPDRWYDNMLFRIGIVVEHNWGFCHAQDAWWC